MTTQTIDELWQENEELRRKLQEGEETIRAIRAGEVDAIFVEAEKVYTLEAADKPYRLLVEQIPQGAAVLTVEGVFLHCNSRFTELLQRPLHSLLGTSIHPFVSPASRPHFEALLRQALDGDSKGEVTLHSPNGTLMPLYLGVSTVQEGVAGLCLVITDLTEQELRKRAEKLANRLAGLHQLTAALCEALTVAQVADVIMAHGVTTFGATAGAVAELSADGSEFVNVRAMGYTQEIAEAWTRFSAAAQLPMADAVRLRRPIVLQSLAERNTRYPELAKWQAIDADGALVALPLLVHGRAVGSLRLAFAQSRAFSAEDLAYMESLSQQCGQALERARLHDAERRSREMAEQEIEERKRTEEALRRSERRLRSVVDHVIDAIITIDECGTVEAFNPAAEKIFGYQCSEILGQNIKVLMPKPYHDEHDGYLANYLRTGQAKIIGSGREVIGRRKDGSIFPMELAVSGFLLEQRRYFTGIVRDITERKRLEGELQLRVQQLAESDSRKNEFLATLAHELRNPLAPIHNALNLMQKRGQCDAELQTLQDILLRQAQQLTRLVDDILDVSRISSGKVQLRHQLHVTLPSEPILLNADPTRLAQVFANLLNNAAKFMEPKGRIWLSAQREGSKAVAVRIRDEGLGIAPDMLSKIFGLFTQADRSLDRSQGGLGIGLSLAQSLVHLHGGTVAAFSEGQGKGSEFVVRLPIVAEALAEKEDATTSQFSAGCPVLRVLVVDDNTDAARILAMLLSSDGHDAAVAHNGKTAIELAIAGKPDVILLDIGLPGMDGFEVCRRLRQEKVLEQTLVAALTGYGHEEDRRKAEEAGFDAHLVKPMEIKELQDLLARAASRKRAAPNAEL
jgi:PAS domain S-box-containing protein